MKLDNTYALMNGDNRIEAWFFAVGTISQQFKPNFPGPDPNTATVEMKFFVTKDC
jgi:hypothetical protein